MSGGSWPLPAGSSRPPRVGNTGRGCREGEPGPGVAPWGRAWRRGPAPGGAGEGAFPPGGGAGLASRAEAPGRGRSTPRPLGARWTGGRRFRGLLRSVGTWGQSRTPTPPPSPPSRRPASELSRLWVVSGSAPRRWPTPLVLALCSGALSNSVPTSESGLFRVQRGAKECLKFRQHQPHTWALLGIETNLVTNVSQSRDGIRTRGHSLGS